MATYATLTINAADIIGADFDRSRCSAYIETNTPHGLVVVDGTSIRLGGRRENPDATGTITFPNLVTTNSADNPTSFAYKVTIVYVPKGSRKQGHDTITTSEFPLLANADLAAIPEAWDDITFPATWRSDFLDQITDLSNIDDTDTAVAYALEYGTATPPYLNTAVDSRIDTSTESGGAVWKVGPTTFNARNYGVSAANSAAANDAALATLFAEETGAVFLAFPDRGTFNFSAPLPARNHLQVSGRGRQTILNWTAGNMLNISGSTLMQSAVFADVSIANSGTASHMIDVTGTGGLIHTTFERVYMKPGVNEASIFKADTFNLFGINFRDCLLHRNATATVPGIDIIGQAGAGTNNIHFTGGEWHSNLCNTTPFFRANTSSGSQITNLTFKNIVGEQNQGGLIHIGGGVLISVKNFLDYDATDYADDIFRFATGTGGALTNVIDIDMAGTYGSATLAGGKAHVRISSGTGHRVGWIPKNATQQGTVVVTPTKGVTIRRDNNLEVGPYEAIGTLPATITLDQHTLVVAGTGTITLPTGAATGQRFQIKAVAGGGCTVSGGGANIDGTATRALVQYETCNVVWSGTTWLRL